MWYEVLPAFAIIAGAIVASGAGLRVVEYFECEGKVWMFDYASNFIQSCNEQLFHFSTNERNKSRRLLLLHILRIQDHFAYN